MEETPVTVGKRRFEVLDGGLRAMSRPPLSQSARPAIHSFGLQQLEPCVGELTTA
jgi:hypothetical protein